MNCCISIINCKHTTTTKLDRWHLGKAEVRHSQNIVLVLTLQVTANLQPCKLHISSKATKMSLSLSQFKLRGQIRIKQAWLHLPPPHPPLSHPLWTVVQCPLPADTFLTCFYDPKEVALLFSIAFLHPPNHAITSYTPPSARPVSIPGQPHHFHTHPWIHSQDFNRHVCSTITKSSFPQWPNAKIRFSILYKSYDSFCQLKKTKINKIGNVHIMQHCSMFV
jgi:hypothetical protein